MIIYSPVSWYTYALALASARLSMTAYHAASVSPVSSDNELGQAFLAADGLSGGYVSRGGELAGVFRHPRCTDRVIDDITAYGLAHGAWWLCCFGNRLAFHWIDADFMPVAFVKWNDELGPRGWESMLELSMKPSIAYMVHESAIPDLPWYACYADDHQHAVDLLQQYNPHPTNGGVFVGGINQGNL